jgi:very-short-patch-repair endonuclease
MRVERSQLLSARRLRRDQTEAEKRMWYLLRGRRFRGVQFRRQHPIDRYTGDFVSLELKLVLELDGGQHNSPEGQASDAVRTATLEKLGFRVIRFWDNDVLSNTAGVLAALERVVREVQETSRPHPANGRPLPPWWER